MIENVKDLFSSIDANSIVRYLSSIALQQWLGWLAGPILLFLGPRIREYFPSFGIGRFLLSAHLERKQNFFTYLVFRSQYSILPLFAGLAALTGQQVLFGFILLSFGIPATVRLVWKQNVLRREIKFFDNCFKVNNLKYTYDQVDLIEKSGENVYLKTRRGLVSLTLEQYELIQPAFWRHGVGSTSLHQQSLDLK